jgi:hypothetical protein
LRLPTIASMICMTSMPSSSSPGGRSSRVTSPASGRVQALGEVLELLHTRALVVHVVCLDSVTDAQSLDSSLVRLIHVQHLGMELNPRFVAGAHVLRSSAQPEGAPRRIGNEEEWAPYVRAASRPSPPATGVGLFVTRIRFLVPGLPTWPASGSASSSPVADRTRRRPPR